MFDSSAYANNDGKFESFIGDELSSLQGRIIAEYRRERGASSLCALNNNQCPEMPSSAQSTKVDQAVIAKDKTLMTSILPNQPHPGGSDSENESNLDNLLNVVSAKSLDSITSDDSNESKTNDDDSTPVPPNGHTKPTSVLPPKDGASKPLKPTDDPVMLDTESDDGEDDGCTGSRNSVVGDLPFRNSVLGDLPDIPAVGGRRNGRSNTNNSLSSKSSRSVSFLRDRAISIVAVEANGDETGSDNEKAPERKTFELRRWWVDTETRGSRKDSMLKSQTLASLNHSVKRRGHDSACTEMLEAKESSLDRFIIEPNSVGNFSVDLVFCFIILFDFLYIPLLAFDVQPFTFSVITAMFAAMLWSLDVLRHFILGFHIRGILVRNFNAVASRYLKGWFAVDFVLVVGDWAIAILISTTDAGASVRSYSLLRFVRLTKLVRVVKLFASLRGVQSRIASERVSIVVKIVEQTLSVVLMCHGIGCGWFAIGKGSSGWVDFYLKGDQNFGYRYTTSFHWALTQLTPASIDIQPTNTAERVFGIFTLLFALVGFSLFVSGITNALQQFRSLSESKSRQMWTLRRFLAENKVSTEVSLRVQAYCGFVWELRQRSVQEKEVEILDLLSTPLRNELHTAVYEPRVVPHAFFMLVSKVAPMTMQEICNHAIQPILIAPGDLLFHESSIASTMYFVYGGTMVYAPTLSGDRPSQNSLSSELLVRTEMLVGRDSWACEVALWIEWVHVGSFFSSTECDLLAITAELFHKAIEGNQNTKLEAQQYSKSFVASLNRTDPRKANDLFEPQSLEGLWFRLLQEFHVVRRTRMSIVESFSRPGKLGGYFSTRVARLRDMTKGLKKEKTTDDDLRVTVRSSAFRSSVMNAS